MIKIRRGTKEDISKARELIIELARYEQAENEVRVTEEQMTEYGFGKDPLFGFFVAEIHNEIVGLALYYFRYSTWKGKRMYLEDLIVTESHRRKGIGKLLFDQMISESIETGCSGMMFQVLGWNKPSIEFYKTYKVEMSDEWLNVHLNHE